MQRRHAIIAAIALVALVLIPAAVLAAGPGGFGHRSPLEGKGLARGPADWAGNATAPNWTGGNCTGAGDCAGNAGCIGDRACDQDRAQQRIGDCLGNVTGSQDQDRTRLRDRSCAGNQTGASGTERPFGLHARAHRGLGR